MVEAEYIEQRQYAENQAEMLKIQQEIAKSKARAEVYGQLDTKSVDSYQMTKYMLLKDVSPEI